MPLLEYPSRSCAVSVFSCTVSLLSPDGDRKVTMVSAFPFPGLLPSRIAVAALTADSVEILYYDFVQPVNNVA